MAAKNLELLKDVLGLTTNKEVESLEHQGIIQKPQNGAYNIKQCSKRYIRYLSEQHTVLQTKYNKVTAERWMVTTQECADFFGVGVHAIHKDVRENGAPRLQKNRIELPVFVQWKINRAQEKFKGRPRSQDEQALELTYQKTRLATVQADVAERDSVTIEDATQALHGVAGIVIGALTARRGRLAGILAPITDPAHVSAKLREEELSLRGQISNRIREFARVGENGSADDGAAAEPIPGRVDATEQDSAQR